MGAGAGYTIETKDVEVLNINDSAINITEVKQWDNGFVKGLTAEVDCDIDAVGSVKAESYYYGTNWIANVPFKITHVSVNIDIGNGRNAEMINPTDLEMYRTRYNVDNVEDLYEELTTLSAKQLSRDYILECIRDGYFDGEGQVGGGWTHSTFDGEATLSLNDHNGYNELYDATIRITSQAAIEFIDQAVTGDNVTYTAFADDDIIDGYATEDEAIEAVKQYIRDYVLPEIPQEDLEYEDFSNYYVERNYDYLVDAGEDTMEYDTDYDYSEVVWTASAEDFI